MCGRYSMDASWADVAAFSRPLVFSHPETEPAAAYNIAPTQQAWVIVAGDPGEGRAVPYRWGLVPFWAKDTRISYSTINARLESAAIKPAFREAWKRRRCLVAASGYYEWQQLAKTKQPYWIHPIEGRVMLFAGLWERNEHVGPEPLHSFTILTTAAHGHISSLHDRMPLCLPQETLADWLHGSPEQAAAIALAANPVAVDYHPVDRAVGNVRNQGRQLIVPLRDTPGSV